MYDYFAQKLKVLVDFDVDTEDSFIKRFLIEEFLLTEEQANKIINLYENVCPYCKESVVPCYCWNDD